MALLKRNPSSQTNEFVAPDDLAKLVAWLDKKRDQGKTKIPELQLKLNLAYVLGQQWVVWDNDKRTFRRPQNRSDDPNAPVRITVNKIGSIVEQYIARATKQAPEPECRPVSDDDDDIGAAKAGTRILQSELNRMHWDAFLLRLYFWVVTHGWAYAQITWDADDGPLVSQADDDDEDVFRGDIDLAMVPAFEMSVDPNGNTMAESKWCVRTTSMTTEAVWEQYGVTVEAEYERTVADEVYSLVDASYDPRGGGSQQVAVHQMWMVPCRAAPKGLVVTWSGKTILEDPMDYPYKHGGLPFVEFDLLPGMGTREGRTWVTDLLPIQADYNDARSREAAQRRTITPKLLFPTGSIDQRNITSRVEAIPYVAVGDKPSWMIPDSGWMAQHEAGMNRARDEMSDRAGQSDVSGGKPQTGSQPAAAILALQEADDTKLAIAAKLMADAIQHVGLQILELVKQYWTEERLVRTWSAEGHLEVAEFSGSDIGGQLDVHVETENGVGRSKSAMVQLAMDLWAQKIITDPRHLLRIIQMPGADFLSDVLNMDARQAQRENGELFTGEIVQVHAYDNHQIHITEHDNFRKGEEYRKLEEAQLAGDPQATKTKAAIDGHVQAHYEQLNPQGAPQIPSGPPYAPAGMPQQPQDSVGHPAHHVRYENPATGGVSLDGSTIAARAGIGGAGQPGAVPGIEPDQQAASMGE